MKLSKVERLILIHQLMILEKLQGAEASEYAHLRTALQEGYTGHYGELFENMADDVPEKTTKEILDILELHRVMHDAAATRGGGGMASDMIRFRGFDANNEGVAYMYTKYFIQERGRYQELNVDGNSLNSHAPMYSRYRAMLRAWEAMDRRRELSAERINEILNAGNRT